METYHFHRLRFFAIFKLVSAPFQFIRFSLINKSKGSADMGASDHIKRKPIPKNAGSTHTHLNRELVESSPDGVIDRTEAISHRIRTAGRKRINEKTIRKLSLPNRIEDGEYKNEWTFFRKKRKIVPQ